MTEIALFAALTLFMWFGPPIKRGGTVAGHNIIRCWLPLDETTESQGQSPEGRRLQEICEWRLLWLAGIITAIPAIWVHPIAIPLAAFAGNAIVRKLTNHLDYVGHGIEIAVAEAEGRLGYREQEIARMLADPARKGMTVEQIETNLARWAWLGRIARWVWA